MTPAELPVPRMPDHHDDARGRLSAVLPAAVLGLGATALTAATAARLWQARRLRRRERPDTDLRIDDDVALHTRTWGRPDADLTVVLVHGFSGGHEEFREQVPALAREARVVAFDQRGHGRSDWGGRSSATISRLGLDLAEVVERRTRGPLVLIGHSMGGMAIMALALRRPDLVRDRVAGVALLSTSAGGLARTVLPPRAAQLMVRTGLDRAVLLGHWFVAPLLERARPLHVRPVRERLHHRMFGTRPPSRDHVRLVDRMWSRTPQSVTSSLLPALAAHSRRDALHTLSGRPALVLTGTHDRTIPPQHSRDIAEAIGSGVRLVEVDGAGHVVNLTHAEEVNDELLHLLRRARGHVGVTRTT